MNIDELANKQAEINEAREKLQNIFGSPTIITPPNNDADIWEVGKNYLVRTVTHIQTGQLVAVGPTELVLTNAAWIADTGRFTNALRDCTFKEVEPFPKDTHVIIGRGALIDAVQIEKLPTEQK